MMLRKKIIGYSLFTQLHRAKCSQADKLNSIESLKRPLYLDMQATTPIDFRVLDKMLPYLTIDYGNPHSKSHLFGVNSSSIVEEARENIASLLNADPNEIVFNSGATESNNTALLGLSEHHFNNKSVKNHIITTTMEHKTVLEACKYIQKRFGFNVTFMEVDEYGRVDINKLSQIINEKTLLFSVMSLNNEVGVIQDLEALGALCEERGVYFHTDAAQAIGKIPLDVRKMNIDLMSFTGHKVFAPKGTGGLFIRDKKKYQNSKKSAIQLAPLIHGGGQERGMRSGTLSPPMVIALGEACKIAQREMQNDNQHIKKLYERMYERIFREVPLVKLNGHPVHRYFGNLNVSFKYVFSGDIMNEIKNKIAFSAGAACLDEPSYVLQALHVDESYAFGAIRIGIGRFTTQEEVDYLLDTLIPIVNNLRQNNKLYQQHLKKQNNL
ncbi:hypothetical protein ABPG74_015432 [Tetrahymena malaccensis]